MQLVISQRNYPQFQCSEKTCDEFNQFFQCSYNFLFNKNLIQRFLLSERVVYKVFGMLGRSPQELFFGKGVLKICSKFTVEHP